MMRRSFLLFVSTAAILVGTILAGGLADRRISESLARPLSQLSREIDGWTATSDQELASSTLRALDPTEYLSRGYRRGDRQLELFIAYYAQQRAGESMHSPKHCLPGAGWEIWKHDSALVSVQGTPVRVNKFSINRDGTRMLMFYWYQSRSRILASEYLGKLLLVRDTIASGRTAGSIVRFDLPDAPGASEEGVRFATALIPEVQRCFGSTSLQGE